MAGLPPGDQARIEAAKKKGVYKDRKPSVPIAKAREMREADAAAALTDVTDHPGHELLKLQVMVLPALTDLPCTLASTEKPYGSE